MNHHGVISRDTGIEAKGCLRTLAAWIQLAFSATENVRHSLRIVGVVHSAVVTRQNGYDKHESTILAELQARQ